MTALAFATGAARPFEVFSTVEAMALAITRRGGPQADHVLALGACTARAPQGEQAIAVYGVNRGAGFLGYALGLGHDRDTLDAALRAARDFTRSNPTQTRTHPGAA